MKLLHLRSAFLHTGGAYVGAFLSAIAVLYLARQVGAEDFASAALGLSFGAMVIPIINLGTDKCLARDAIRAGDRQSEDRLGFFNFALRLVAFTVLLVAGFTYIFSSLLPDEYDGWTFLVFACWMGANGLQLNAFFDYQKITKKHLMLNFFERSSALIVIAILSFNSRSEELLLLGGTSLLALRLLFLISQMMVLDFRLVYLRGVYYKNIGLCPKAALALFANAIASHGSQPYVADHLGQQSVSVFAIILQIMALIFMAQSMYVRLHVRELTKLSERLVSINNLSLYLKEVLIVSFVIDVGLFLIIHLLPYVMSSQSYAVSFETVLALMVWTPIVGIGLIFGHVALVRKGDLFYLLNAIFGAVLFISIISQVLPGEGLKTVFIVIVIIQAIRVAGLFLYVRKSIKHQLI